MKRYYRVIYGIDDFVEVVELKGDTEDDNVLSAKINCQDYLSENIGSNSVVEYLGSDESAAFKQYEDCLELDELKNAIKVLKRSPQLARLKAHNERVVKSSVREKDDFYEYSEEGQSAKAWLDCIEFITNDGLLGLPKTHPMDRPNKLGKVKDMLGMGEHLEQSIINEIEKK